MDDYLEIINYGLVLMDVSCLVIEWLFDGGSEIYFVLRGLWFIYKLGVFN